MPGEHAADSGRETIDNEPTQGDKSVSQDMGQQIDANMPVAAARRDSADQRKPEHEKSEKLVRPDKTGIKNQPQNNLAAGQNDNRRK